FECIAYTAQAGQACSRLEQHLADVILRIQYAVASLDQPWVVKAEHFVEKTSAGTSKKRIQRRIRQVAPVGRTQGILVGLQAHKLQHALSMSQFRPNA